MCAKLLDYGRTAWNHKKKIIFFSGLGAWGVSYLNALNNEQKLRSSYAKRAERIGAATIGSNTTTSDYVAPKLHVFIDYSDPQRHKNLASFNKNVLPLLYLAGFDVLIKSAADAKELNEFSSGADVRDCVGIAVVGSRKFALPAVLSGLFINGGKGAPEARTALAIFDPEDKDDVEARCKKAMRIINGQREQQHVYSTATYVRNTDDKTLEVAPEKRYFRLADIHFGWFDYCREWSYKFWWFGALQDRMAHTWYFLKRYPQPTPILARISAQCTGCRRCVTEAPRDPSEENRSQRWWQGWIGRREQPGDKRRRQFANVINENCGRIVDLHLDAVDVLIRNLNDGVYGGLQLRTIDSFTSRWQAIWRVWTEWDKNKSPENFFTDKSAAQTIELQLKEPLPPLVQKTHAAKRLGQANDELEISRIVVETLPHVIQVY